MSGSSLLLDTNCVLSILGGALRTDFLPEGVSKISVITELELLSYPLMSKNEETSLKNFLAKIEILNLTSNIKEHTIDLRKQYRLKLPDAIICASALCERSTLVTFDKALKKIKEITVLIPDK